jgi:flagellar assembly factor FliW
MEIKTRYFGEIEVNEKEVVQFVQGIPGFKDEQEFVVLPFSEEDTPYSILQSIKTSSLAFVLGNPFVFFPEYEFDLPEGTTELLQIESEQDVAVYVILTVQEPFENTTANLKAPIIINQTGLRGKQVVLNSESYETKHLILREAVTKEGR